MTNAPRLAAKVASIFAVLVSMVFVSPSSALAQAGCASTITGTLTADAYTIRPGGTSNLKWQAVVPPGCEASFRINTTPIGFNLEGNFAAQPTVNTTYQLQAFVPDPGVYVDLDSLQVAVNSNVVRIEGNSSYWKILLINSLKIPGTKIILDRYVNMDLSSYKDIAIAESVELTGDDVGFTRSGLELGPRLFTKTKPSVFMKMNCDTAEPVGQRANNVKIHGFRLIGPLFGIGTEKRDLTRGLRIESCVNIEIWNMEIAGWSNSAIEIKENPAFPQITEPDDIYIHNNFIHHNQFEGSSGYGVSTGAGTWARVEMNVFDYNRHAIKSAGEPNVGYIARNNLVLSGGGFHRKIAGHYFYTHQFDVHGDQSCGVGHLNCGNAGQRFAMINNTFQYTSGHNIKIRGKPFELAEIFGNVFPQSDPDDAIALRTRTNVVLGTASEQMNIFDSFAHNSQTYGAYKICDIDGDGRDDLFLPAGRTWWYAAAAKLQWSFLRAETLGTTYLYANRYRLGDVTGDGRCDAIKAISVGNNLKLQASSYGTEDWTSMPVTLPYDEANYHIADFDGDGRADVFARDFNGQWFLAQADSSTWTPIQSSSLLMRQLRFGDFNGDHKTDVLAVVAGSWHMSSGGTGAWQKLNSLSAPMDKIHIGDFNADGKDDIIAIEHGTGDTVQWAVSLGGRSPWKLRGSHKFGRASKQSRPFKFFVGRFDDKEGADILIANHDRYGYIVTYSGFLPQRYSNFPY